MGFDLLLCLAVLWCWLMAYPYRLFVWVVDLFCFYKFRSGFIMCCFSLKRRFAFLWHALPQGEAHSVRRTLFAWRVLCTNALGSYTRSSGVNFALAEMPLRGRGLRHQRAFRVSYRGKFTWLLSRISISILFRLFSSPRALSVDRLLFYALFFSLYFFQPGVVDGMDVISQYKYFMLFLSSISKPFLIYKFVSHKRSGGCLE